MIKSILNRIRRQANRLGSFFALLSLAGSSFVFTSCTTEEGVIAGALAGAAIGGLVGHSQENAYKRNRHVAYRNNNYGYRNNNRYSRGRDYYPRQSRYSDYRGGYRDPYCSY